MSSGAVEDALVTIERWLPCVGWLRRYHAELLRGDAMAAVIVTIMLIPQSLAYAMLAGLPPEVGLYASIAPLAAYALLGSSGALAVGPVAVVSLMTAAAVGDLAAVGTPEYRGAAVVLAALSGIFLLALGLLRLGFLASLLSHPVISGFITASGVLIATSQLGHLLGIPARGDTLLAIGAALVTDATEVHWPTAAIGAGAIAFLLWSRSRSRSLLMRLGLGRRLADAVAKAAPVMAVVATIALVRVLGLEAAGVRVVGEIPGGLPPIALPSLDPALWAALLPSAVLISVVGFVESVSVAQTLAAKRRERIEPNRELLGLGAANLAASVSGGFPVTGGFARSVVNFDAGARTPLAGVLAAVGIALTALYLTPVLRALPTATLAATIVVAVLSLVDLGALRRTWIYSRADFAAMALTIATVLLAGVERGIVAGVGLSVALFLARSTRPHIAVVGQVPGTQHFRNVLRHAVLVSPRVLSVRVDESLYFANARFLEDRLYDLAVVSREVRDVVLICSAVNDIDASALESLEALNQRLGNAGVRFHLSEVKGPVMDRLERSHFLDQLSGEVYLSQHDALRALDPELTARADGAVRPPGSAAARAPGRDASAGRPACARDDRPGPTGC
ncbi:MAG: sulfate permease [Ectothiorhodospiraceae bacterium]|nr:sulfate permease [Chromatiales bacterium]MCP5153585.1 sulfate permease [Ectothiorhodospiraceae bacterium]